MKKKQTSPDTLIAVYYVRSFGFVLCMPVSICLFLGNHFFCTYHLYLLAVTRSIHCNVCVAC